MSVLGDDADASCELQPGWPDMILFISHAQPWPPRVASRACDKGPKNPARALFFARQAIREPRQLVELDSLDLQPSYGTRKSRPPQGGGNIICNPPVRAIEAAGQGGVGVGWEEGVIVLQRAFYEYYERRDQVSPIWIPCFWHFLRGPEPNSLINKGKGCHDLLMTRSVGDPCDGMPTVTHRAVARETRV